MDRINSNLPWVSVDIDVKAKNVISQKQSVKSYASRVFRESTIGIVSSIVTTHSKYRRFFKIFLSSLCITGFLYQCVTFLNHVFEYPTVINIAVDRSNTYRRPAYTFCNNNVIKRSLFCRMYPDHCIEPSEEFCKKFSSYCGANKTLIPMEKYYGVEKAMSYGDILKYGGDARDEWFQKYVTRSFLEKPSGPYLRNNRGITKKMICYSLDSVVENNQQPSQVDIKKMQYYRPISLFVFYVNEREMMNPTSEPGFLFSVHSPLQFVNPFERGIFLRGGRTYKIFLEMQEEILLKEPFETNCKDYEDVWEKNNRSGPRTQKMCQEKCQLDSYLSIYKCAKGSLLYPSKERICDLSDYANTTIGEIMKSVEWVTKCQESCRDNCRLIKYTTEVSVRYQVDSIKEKNPNFEYVCNFNSSLKHCLFSAWTGKPTFSAARDIVQNLKVHRYIAVEIYLSSDVINILSLSPKYMTVEVFSSIGGFMGCWLGIALLDILDVFGSMLTVFRYAFGKRM